MISSASTWVHFLYRNDNWRVQEETLVPLETIRVKQSIDERKKLRTMQAERLKMIHLKKANEELTKIRKETEKDTVLKIAPKVFENLSVIGIIRALRFTHEKILQTEKQEIWSNALSKPTHHSTFTYRQLQVNNSCHNGE